MWRVPERTTRLEYRSDTCCWNNDVMCRMEGTRCPRCLLTFGVYSSYTLFAPSKRTVVVGFTLKNGPSSKDKYELWKLYWYGEELKTDTGNVQYQGDCIFGNATPVENLVHVPSPCFALPVLSGCCGEGRQQRVGFTLRNAVLRPSTETNWEAVIP